MQDRRVSKRDRGDLVTTLPLEFKQQKQNLGHNTHILAFKSILPFIFRGSGVVGRERMGRSHK